MSELMFFCVGVGSSSEGLHRTSLYWARHPPASCAQTWGGVATTLGLTYLDSVQEVLAPSWTATKNINLLSRALANALETKEDLGRTPTEEPGEHNEEIGGFGLCFCFRLRDLVAPTMYLFPHALREGVCVCVCGVASR